MSFYHVVIQKKSSEESVCIYKDLSKMNLNKQLIKPYKLNKDLFYDGNILPASELSKIKIILTEKPHKDELKILQDESFKRIQELNKTSGIAIVSLGSGYRDYEIEICGNDVTTHFLSQGPGSGTLVSNMMNAIKHPWMVRIFGGIGFIIIVTYLGLQKS